jgi:hypothetical protein
MRSHNISFGSTKEKKEDGYLFTSPEIDSPLSHLRCNQESGGLVIDSDTPSLMIVDAQDRMKIDTFENSNFSSNISPEETKMSDHQEHDREELNSTIVPGKSRFPIKYSKQPDEPGTDSKANAPSFEPKIRKFSNQNFYSRDCIIKAISLSSK